MRECVSANISINIEIAWEVARKVSEKSGVTWKWFLSSLSAPSDFFQIGRQTWKKTADMCFSGGSRPVLIGGPVWGRFFCWGHIQPRKKKDKSLIQTRVKWNLLEWNSVYNFNNFDWVVNCWYAGVFFFFDHFSVHITSMCPNLHLHRPRAVFRRVHPSTVGYKLQYLLVTATWIRHVAQWENLPQQNPKRPEKGGWWEGSYRRLDREQSSHKL